MSTVQEALKAREERKKKDQEQAEAKNSKVTSALDAYKSRKKSSSQSAVTDLVKRINSEVDAMKSNSTTPSWGEGSLKTALDATRENTVNIGKLKREIESYKGYIDDDTYNSLSSTVDQLSKGYDSYLSMAEVREQFENEDAYNQWYKEYSRIEEEKQAVLGAEDFEDYLQKGKEVDNPSWDAAQPPIVIAGWEPLGSGKKVNNMVTFAEENKLNGVIASTRGEHIGHTETVYLINEYMTDEEKQIYNYYIGKGETDKAEKYLTDVMDTLRQKSASEIADAIEGNVFLEGTFAIAAGLDQFASGVGNLDNLIMGTEADPITTTQYASGMVREDILENSTIKIGDYSVGTVAYDAVTSTANMLPSILVGFIPGVGQAASLATLGASAVGNGYAEMRRLGYSANQARAYGVLVGISEAALQYAIGGISALGGKVSGNVIAKAISNVDNALARTAIKIGGNMLSEGIEESVQSVLEPIFNSIITGEDLDIDWGEVAYSGLLGAITAGVLESPVTVANEVNTYKAGKNLKQDTTAIDRLTKLGSTMSADSVAYRLAGKIDENTGAYTIGRLLNEVGASLSEKNMSDIILSLERKGVNTKDAQTIAKWLNKAVEGEYFNKKQRDILENNDVVSKTFADVIVNQNSTVWQRINGYNEIQQIAETEATEQQTKDISATKNPTAKESGSEAKNKSSESGKIRLGDTEVSIKEIASIKDGETMLRLEDGSTVSSRDIEFANNEEGLIYEAVADMKLNAATANAFIKGYNPSEGLSVNDYILGFREAYRYGEYGFPVNEMSQEGFSASLSQSQKELAYGLGKTDAKYKIEAKQKAVADKSSATVSKKEQVSKGRVHYEGGVLAKSMTSRQKASLKGLETLAEALGIDFHVFESEVDANGKRKGANGWFNPKDGSIHIDLYAGQNGEGTMLFTAAHELTHFIREWSPAKFKVFADFLLEQYGQKGISVDELVNRQIEKAKRNGREIDYDTAYEEVIADSCEAMLADGDAIAKIAELKAKDKTLWQKIKDFITDLVAKIKAAYEGLSPDSVEGQYVSEMLDSAEKLKALWTEALVDASDSYIAAEKTLSENGIAVDSETDSASLLSVRDVLNDDQRQKVSTALAERFGVTQEEAMAWLKAETSMASLILNPKYSKYLDYTADPNEVAIKQNSDYPQGTVDFSPICAKRREFTSVMNNILRLFPNHVFAATDLAKIRSIMQEEGMTIPCGICYVEDRRQLDTIVAQNFIDSLKLYREGSKTRPDGKAFNTNQLKGLKLTDGDSYTPSVYELVSLEGLNVLKEKNPNMAEAWVKFNNARGMQSVRLLANEAEYKRQILKYDKRTVKSKNDKGGLRVYSFSDAEMFHLIDIIQVITDSAAVGLSLQGYTKVNEYAKAVKDTGEKLNRSLIPKGERGYHIEDGKVVLDYDTVEGIDINHPDFFDNKDNPNVGNITIGVSDVQIRAAMVSDFVDQIIPFHTGQSEEVLGEKGIATWSNYKDFQTEKDIATDKVSDHQINIYTEVLQVLENEGKPITKRTFVEKFLQVCKENNLTPRFSQFLNTNENGEFIYTEGYHKMLVDFKTFAQTEVGEYLPQKPVKPIFDDGYITRVMKDYVKSQKVKDADIAKSMPKVIERITNEIVKPSETKLSDRDIQESFGIKSINDYIGVQKAVVDTLTREGFFSDGNNIVVNKDGGMVVEITKDGIRETLGKGTRFQSLPRKLKELKLSTIRSLPYLIETAHLDEDNVLNVHNPESKVKYAYLSTDINVQGENGENTYTVTITVRKSPQKNKFWVHEIRTIKKEQGLSSSGDVNPQQEYNKTLAQEGIISQDTEIVNRKFSDRDSYAPTFYSHMGKVIDDIRIDKMGAGGVVSYLKGKGVKNEEIKWSGIETFLEGKKSVTKAELQEFVAGSQLQIVEQMSGEDIDLRYDGSNRAYNLYDSNGNVIDTFTYNEFLDGYVAESDEEIYSHEIELKEALREEYGITSAPRWAQYKLDGGSNYRELVFQLPNSSYSNRAMRGHWGQDAEGVLVHARIQDFVVDGKKMLFIEELQSDWHNEGREKGYTTKEYEDAVTVYDKLADDYAKKRQAFNKYVRSSEFRSDPDEVSKKKFDWLRSKMDTAEKRMQDAERDIEALKKKGMGDVADAPFKDTYHEYVLKRLLRMAAEEGYDSLGWTPADIQSQRWSYDYEKAYQIEYDQEMPKFLRKYGKQWGATVGTAMLDQGRKPWQSVDALKKMLAYWQNELITHPESDEFIRTQIKHYEEELRTAQATGETVWSMDITDSMKNSVLTEGQPLYSDRDHDSVSNRSLLANALESVAQNDIEKTKLAQYKEKIELIESEQAKLSDLRAKIKELSFAKGAKDTKAIKSLQFEANQAASRINTYDKQLLNLESTKALKDVLEREKEMARKRERQKGKEALTRQREKAAETQRELMTRYQESRKKNVESRHKTAMRHKIKDVVNELNQYLTKGTKDKHVPIELQKAVAEALDAVNMDTVGAEERIAKKREEMMRAKTPEAIEKLAKEIENIQEMGGNMAKKLSRLKTAYDSIINSDDPLIANSHDDVISSSIDKVIEVVGETPLRDMSLYQLEAVYDMYKMVLTSVRNANKAFKAKKSEEISVIANRVMAEIDTLGKKKLYRTKAAQAVSTFDWNNLKPVYAFERIGSNTFTEVFNNVRAGEDTWAVDITEAKEFSTEQRKKYNYKSWDFKKRYGFKSSSGKDFELSLDQIMSLYAYSKREQAKDHLKKGGIVIDETTEVTVKTKLGIPVKFNPTQATAYNLSDETLADIISKLTPEQKAFVDVMQDYLSTTMGEKGNEVSVALYGVKLYKEKNYFPLKSATQFMAKAKEQQKGEVKIKNSGFSKETAPKASNPIVLTPFMDVWANHVNDMSMYHAFVLPLEDFYRVFNYKTPTSDTMATESVEMYLQNAYGKAATQYIDQLLKDLNGGARVDSTTGIINKLTGLFKKSAVFASASVVVQQPSAIARAVAIVDTKYFVGMPNGKHKTTWAEVKKYAPVAVIKEMGYFDTGMGQSTVEWIKDEKTLKDKIDDVASKAPALADEYAWCAIWDAVKRETLHTHKDLKPNSEEFLKAVGERFTEVITKTQVYDSVLSRSANMRSKDTGMKMATAFMGEPTTSLNMLENALTQGKRGNIKYTRKAIGSVAASMILNSILVSFVYAGRDDDDDETYTEKYISTLTEELLDSFNPLTLMPFIKDIVSIVQGYDVERSDMAVITDIIKAWKNLDNDNRSTYRKVEDFAGAIASIFGLPVKNVMRDARAMYNTVSSFISGEKTTGTGIKIAVTEAVTGKEISNGQQLYEAIIKGDTEYAERVKSRFKDQNAIDSALRKALRDNDPRIKEAAVARYNGDTAEYMRIAKEIIAERNFSQDNIVAAINAEINAMDKGETTSTPDKEKSIVTVEDYYNALVNRDEATAYNVKEDIIRVAIANGKDRDEAESSFISSFTSHIRDEYEKGDLSSNEAKDMLMDYADKTEKEANSKVRYWDFEQEYPEYDDLIESAVTTYYEEVEPYGISVSTYYDYSIAKAKCKGTDSNNDGKADSGTKKAEIMAVINSLPLTSKQKDALYFANGWSKSTLYEAPWH